MALSSTAWYSSRVVRPAQGARHWPISWWTQGRWGFSGRMTRLQVRMGKTMRATSSTSRTAVAPL